MTKRRRIVIPVLLVLAALVAALLLLSKYGLSVTRLSLEFDDLPRGFDGFKIVQLSDLHGSEFGRDNARLIKAVADEEPDLIALTGDFLDEGKAGRELPALEALVKELVKLAPVYFVSGNHDWASGAAPELFETLGAAGVNCLRNDFVYLERGGKFDIIFLDPPYDTTLLDKCLEIVQNVDILTDGGIIVCESRREKVLPELKAPFARIIDRNYGKIKITVYKKES